MVDQYMLDDFVHRALNRFVFEKTCYIAGGTGTILKHFDKFYIITCKHVCDILFANSNEKVILKNNSIIKKEELKLVGNTDSEIDIAILEILKDEIDSDYFTINNFEFINDFSALDFSNSILFLLGHPFDLSYLDEYKRRVITYFSYMTLIKKDKPAQQNFIYLEYPKDSDSNRLINTDLHTELPKPNGISGALLFQINVSEFKKSKVWSPTLTKAIAIQQSWNKNDGWIK